MGNLFLSWSLAEIVCIYGRSVPRWNGPEGLAEFVQAWLNVFQLFANSRAARSAGAIDDAAVADAGQVRQQGTWAPR
jgi:hypothetical protein